MSDSRDAFLQYGPRREIAARFEAASVAALYHHRPAYSPEVYALLAELAGARGRRVLDAGAGTGRIARELVARGFDVDAVDPSHEMIQVGRGLPHGDDPKLRWIPGRIEEEELSGGYALATAGASFHWFEKDEVLPRLHELLEPGAFLAVVNGDRADHAPWEEAEEAVMIDFVTRMQGKRPEWHRADIEDVRLLEHPLFEPVGERVTAPQAVRQHVDDYIACQHSRATFTHEVMGDLSEPFDQALRAVLTPHADEDGSLGYRNRSRIEWGRPLSAGR